MIILVKLEEDSIEKYNVIAVPVSSLEKIKYERTLVSAHTLTSKI